MTRSLALTIGLGAVGIAVAVILLGVTLTESPGPTPPIGFVATASPTATGVATPGATPTPTAEPTPTPSPTPVPTPTLVPDPLTGRMVTQDVANRHPIAVMIDDQFDARPQSGLSMASVVWQAPAEGGIPRYMAIFQDQIPGAIGPVRSARYYFIVWASEWKAVYAHAGGSPQALDTLKAKGSGQYVYNADGFRYSATFRRIRTRFAPHNLYTDGASLRKLATKLKAKDGTITPIWQFAPDAALEDRPVGGTIAVTYPYNAVKYAYDQGTNTYLRTVTGESKQTDAANKTRIAPKNVVIMRMHFGPLNDGHPKKHRLEAQMIGSGPAWFATNGHTITGTWKKTSVLSPTKFFDSKGNPITLTIGQTFVQVVPYGYTVSIKDGKLPTASPSPSASPSSLGDVSERDWAEVWA
jgi:hypothetical protein